MAELKAALGQLPRINESEFVKVLPKLLSRDTKASREAWLPYVGNLRVACEVVDSDGEVIFIVPPLEIGFNFNDDTQFATAVMRSNARSSVSEAQADEILAEAFVKSTDMQVHVPKEHMDQWEIILKRYGLHKDSNGAEVVQETKEEQALDFEDEEDW